MNLQWLNGWLWHHLFVQQDKKCNIVSYHIQETGQGEDEISRAELGTSGQIKEKEAKEKEANIQAIEDRMGDLGKVELKLGSVGMGKGRHRRSWSWAWQKM